MRESLRKVFLAGVCLAIMPAALADVKVTAKVTVTGSKGTETRTVTTYYKGALIRTETETGVSIYDSAAQTITTFRTGEKTYRLLDLKSALNKMPGLATKMKVTSKADVKPMPDQSVIAGKPAKKYVGSAAIQIGVEGMAGGGPTTHIEIEQWMTEAVSVESQVSPLQQFVGPLNQFGGMEPVAEAFAKMKGLPLSSKVKISMEGAKTGAGEIVTTTQVQSVEEAPLSDSLFKVPAGYTLQPGRTPTFPNRKAP